MEYALEVNQLNKSFAGKAVLKDISFKVSKGSVHGFLGPNGAGKSTTMKIIAGLLKESSGEVKITLSSCHENPKEKIGLLPEFPPLYEDMVVVEFLVFIAEINGLKGNKAFNSAMEAVKLLNLFEVKDRLIKNLSRGYKQRVAIAQAFVYDPELIILDEPTVGLDPQSIQEIRSLIKKFKGEKTILLSSHLMHEVSLNCDEVTIVNEGSVVASGKLNEVLGHFSQSIIIEAELGFNNREEVIKLIEKMESVAKVEALDSGASHWIRIFAKENESSDKLRAKIAKKIIENNGELLSLREKEKKLEDVFLTLTEKNKERA